MSLRNFAKFSLVPLTTPLRKYSTQNSNVAFTIQDKTGIGVATLNRPPVNSLNLELLTDLRATLVECEQNRVKGLILTSISDKVFSAGLDITEMYKPEMGRCTNFWTTLQDVWLKLYGSTYPTVAVVNGHAPAGGCLLAMSCEYRVMLPKFTIGLNETQLGIVAPNWFIASMRNTIGRRQAELALTTGRLFSTDEALQVGLVDEVASDKAEAFTKAEKFLEKFSKISPLARGATKVALRGIEIQELLNNKDKDLQIFLSYVNQDKVQKGLEIYMEALKKRKS